MSTLVVYKANMRPMSKVRKTGFIKRLLRVAYRWLSFLLVLQTNDGKILINDGEMSVESYTHFTIIDEHFTIIGGDFTIISLSTP